MHACNKRQRAKKTSAKGEIQRVDSLVWKLAFKQRYIERKRQVFPSLPPILNVTLARCDRGSVAESAEEGCSSGLFAVVEEAGALYSTREARSDDTGVSSELLSAEDVTWLSKPISSMASAKEPGESSEVW